MHQKRMCRVSTGRLPNDAKGVGYVQRCIVELLICCLRLLMDIRNSQPGRRQVAFRKEVEAITYAEARIRAES